MCGSASAKMRNRRSLSRSASSACLCSVMSRARATVSRRPPSQNGRPRTSTGNTDPSFRRWRDSNTSISPASSLRPNSSSMAGVTSGSKSSGVIPTNSSRVYPRLWHAWRFTSTTTSWSSCRKKASVAWSTNVRNRCSLARSASSARFRSVISTLLPMRRIGLPAGSRTAMPRVSRQRSEPSLCRDRNSISNSLVSPDR